MTKKLLLAFISRYWIPLVLFALLIGLNLLSATSPLASVYGIVKLVEFTLFTFAGIAVLRNEKDGGLQKIAICLAVGMILTGILAIGQVMQQGSLGGLWYFLGERSFSAETPGIANAVLNGALVLRPYATFPHPNVLAWYLFFGIVLHITKLLKSEWSKRMSVVNGLVIVAVLISVPTLFLTLSRSVILLFLLYLVLLPLQLTKNMRSRSAIVVLCSLGVVLSIGILFFSTICNTLCWRFRGKSAASITDCCTQHDSSFSRHWRWAI